MEGAPGLIAVRLVEYVSASLLFGAPLVAIYSPRPALRPASPRLGLLRAQFAAALTLGLATLTWVALETATMGGDPAQATDAGALRAFLTETPFGWAALARLAACSGTALLSRIGPKLRAHPTSGLIVCGAVALASLAWNGHGAASEGLAGGVHLTADVLHLLSAAAWVGALVSLTFQLLRTSGVASVEKAREATEALAGFSGVGTAIVAVLLISGMVNGWFLIGPTHLHALLKSDYGRLVSLKLVLFSVMFCLAAVNRFSLTPRLRRRLALASAPRAELLALRRSLIVETTLAGVVLAVVARLGTMMPPTSMS